MRAAAHLIALALAVGCGGTSEVDLFVDVRTDLVPGVEFVGVRVEDAEHAPVDRIARRDDDFLRGVRVAELTGLRSGSRRVVASLLDAGGDTVARRPVVVDLRRSSAVTVLFTRSCRDVDCDEELACLRAECVDPRCAPETPEACPAPECAVAGDCPAGAPCATPTCAEGTCLLGDTGACGEGAYCEPEVGCLPLGGGGLDAGGPDAGGLDAGGLDAGGPDAGSPDAGRPPGFDAGDCSGLCAESCFEDCLGACGCPIGCPCNLSCLGTCSVECNGPGTACTVRARMASSATVLCGPGAWCRVLAPMSSVVDVTCSGTEHCDVDCSGTSTCLVSCSAPTGCSVRCDACAFRSCAGLASSCPDGTIVCNRACP